MKTTSKSFVLNIEEDFSPELEKSVFENLFDQYERVIFSSIITAFGLDLFIKDQHGGDVDTIYNVRKINDDREMKYKNKRNEADYENRGSYSHKDIEGSGTNFQRIKAEARQAYHENNNNTVQDAYENKQLGFLGNGKGRPTDKNANLDHVIAANTIHNDRGRLLAGLSTRELADDESNLKYTNEHLNKSMSDDEIPEYIEKHPELPDDVKKRMMEHYNKAKAVYEKKLAKAYYLDLSNPNCRRFYFDTAKAAGKRGLQMGARQVLGFVLTEVWFCIKDSLKTAGKKTEDKISAIINGIKSGFESAKNKYKDIISKLGQGVLGGIMSSLSTTLCNIFFTTTKNLARIIRQAWSSIVEAAKVILFNPDDLWFCDRMTAALKILATGASVIIGTSIQETLRTQLTVVPGPLADIISSCAGSLCTGLLTITLLFYIDNNPFDSFLNKAFDETIKDYKHQAKLFNDYCAKLKNIDIERFKQETEFAGRLASAHFKDDTELNQALNNTAKLLDIKCPWGERSLDDAMNDPDFQLVL